MGFADRTRRMGGRANDAAHQMAQRIDDSTGETGERLAKLLVIAVRLSRIPTAVVLYLPIPFIAAILVLGIKGGGWFGLVLTVTGVVMAIISAAFWGRRRRIVQAVDDPDQLATELRQVFNLTGRVDDASDTVRELTTGDGWQVFGRLRTVWRGVTLPAQWMDQIGELHRARYFAPPKIGTTMSLTIVALWLIPFSIIAAVMSVIGTIAGSL